MKPGDLKMNQLVKVKIYSNDSGWIWLPATVIDPYGAMVTVQLQDGRQIGITANRIRPINPTKIKQISL